MSLYVWQGNIPKHLKELESHLYSDLYYPTNSILGRDEMYYTMGSYDEQLFRETTYDWETYSQCSVRDLYETMFLIKKNRVPENEMLYEKSDDPVKRIINISEMTMNRIEKNRSLLRKAREENEGSSLLPKCRNKSQRGLGI